MNKVTISNMGWPQSARYTRWETETACTFKHDEQLNSVSHVIGINHTLDNSMKLVVLLI